MKLLLTIPLFAVVLFSCRASKQHKTSDIDILDTTKVLMYDSIAKHQDQSTEQENKDVTTSEQVEATLIFEADPKGYNDSTDQVVLVKIDGNGTAEWLEIALQNPRLKSANIKGKKDTKDKSMTNKKKDVQDSTAVHQGHSLGGLTVKVKETEETETEQFSIWRLFPWYVWLFLAGLLFITIRYLYKRYWPGSLIKKLFKPKKNENSI